MSASRRSNTKTVNFIIKRRHELKLSCRLAKTIYLKLFPLAAGDIRDTVFPQVINLRNFVTSEWWN